MLQPGGWPALASAGSGRFFRMLATICTVVMRPFVDSTKRARMRALAQVLLLGNQPEPRGRAMKRADKLTHTIEESFPASDAPANTVVTGVRVGPSAEFVVRDNPEESRLETEVNGQIATLRYQRHPHAVVLVETEVPPSFAAAASPTRSRSGPSRRRSVTAFGSWRRVPSCGRTSDATPFESQRRVVVNDALTGRSGASSCQSTSRCRSGAPAVRYPAAG